MISILFFIPLFISSCALPFFGIQCPLVPETGFISPEYVQTANLILLDFMHFSKFYSSPLFNLPQKDLHKIFVRLLITKSADSFVLNMSVPETFPIGGSVAYIRQDRATGQVTANSSLAINGTCSESDCGSVQNKLRIWEDVELLIIYSCEDTEPNGGMHEEAVLLFYNSMHPFNIQRIKQLASKFLPYHLMNNFNWGLMETKGATGDLEGYDASELEKKRLRNVKIFGVACLLAAVCLVAHWVYLFRE